MNFYELLEILKYYLKSLSNNHSNYQCSDMIGEFDDLDIAGLGVIGLGLLIFAGSYGITPSTENDITRTRKEIKASEDKITLLIKILRNQCLN